MPRDADARLESKSAVQQMEPPASGVREQLDRILACGSFARSRKLSEFLRFVVVETLNGRGGELKEYGIGTEVYGRPGDFDPVTDNIVRVEARRLRVTLQKYYAGEGADEPIVVSVPKGGYVPAFVWRGRTVGEAAPREENDSIAVLPFEDFSQERDQSHFCSGIAEEIINSLVQVNGLRVVSRTSAFAYQGQSADVRRIGKALHAGTILEGSVRKEGGQLRITAQLIDAGNGYHLWSRQFDRGADGELAVQAEVAQAICFAIHGGRCRDGVNPE